MSRRRRAALLLGLALVLGGLAASDVSRREATLDRRLHPLVAEVVARRDLEPGTRLTADQLAVRRVPARFAPAGGFPAAGELVGLRTAVAVPAGAYLSSGEVSDASAAGGGAPGSDLRPGERVANVVAVGSPGTIVPGSRVDVLVTREPRDGGNGQTQLALEDVEVLAANPAQSGGGNAPDSGGADRVSASLRVTLRQAVFLAAAQSFAREVRLLPRAPGDRRRGAAGMTVDAGLR